MFELINESIKENEKAEEEIVDPELDEILSERDKYQIEKKAQADALVEAYTKDPKAMIISNISEKSINLVKTDDDFKRQIEKAGKDVAQGAIDEVAGKTRKGKNQNYYLGREEAIESLGGNSKTSKDKQTYINIIYNIWWYILMTVLGIPYIAPLKVLLNWAKALSPTVIANIEEDGKVRTEEVKQMHWAPLTFAIMFYIAYLIGLGFLIYFFIKNIIK